MTFDYCPNCTKLPVALSREQFEQLIREPWLSRLSEEIAAGNLDRKRELPAVCWQAAFGGEKRSNKTAQPSGLFALDIDHVEKPEVLFYTFEDRIDELGIYVVHKTSRTPHRGPLSPGVQHHCRQSGLARLTAQRGARCLHTRLRSPFIPRSRGLFLSLQPKNLF